MSESRDDGDRRPSGGDSGGHGDRSSWAEATRAAGNGQPAGSGQPGSSQSAGSSKSAGGGQNSGGQNSASQNSGSQSGGRQNNRQSGKPASDPVADLQRWLMRAGARSMANQVADNVRRTLGQQRRESSGDVWDTATTEPSPEEPPECQWCPVCQAARRLRDSGPGLGAKLADAGGVLASVVQDAFSAVDQIIKTSSERPAAHPQVSAASSGGSTPQDSTETHGPDA